MKGDPLVQLKKFRKKSQKPLFPQLKKNENVEKCRVVTKNIKGGPFGIY